MIGSMRQCLVLCFASLTLFSAGDWVVAGAYEDYKALEATLNSLHEPEATILQDLRRKTEAYQRRYARGTPNEKTMAAYLCLRVALLVEDDRLAYEATESLLQLQPNASQRRDLTKLAAQLAYRMHRYERADAYIREWLALTPSDSEVGHRREKAEMLTLSGYVLRALGRPREALASVKTAYGWVPEKDRGQLLLSLCAELGDEKEERDFLPVMVRDWNDRVHWNRWGYLEWKAGNERKALNVFSSAEKAGLLESGLVPVLLALVMKYEAPTKAIALLTRYPQAWPRAERETLLLSLWIRIGDREKAKTFLEQTPLTEAGNEGRQIELAYAARAWNHARTGAHRLIRKLDTPTARDRWRYIAGMSAYYDNRLSQAAEDFSAMETETWRNTVKPWLDEIRFLTD